MNTKVISRTVLAAGALLCCAAPQIALAATNVIPCETGPAPSSVTSCATGVYVNLSVLGGVIGATIGPLANAFGAAPAAYNVTTQVASVNASAGLGLLGALGVNTGIITDSASSPYNGTLATLSSTGTSTVNGLNLALGIPAIFPLPAISALSISATTLTSTSSASKIAGDFTTSGSSGIEGLNISILGTPLSIDASALVNAPVDTDLLSVALQNTLGLNIYANYQTPILDGSHQIGTQTSALAVLLNGFGYGGGVLNGTILIADSAASVPEPATWAMMIFGFGLVGGLTRRRQIAARALG